VSTPAAPPEHGLLPPAGRSLLEFARAARNDPVGFTWLDEDGRPDPDRGVHTWISTRMTFAFALGSRLGVDGAGDLAAHGVRSLLGPQQDAEHGGWFECVAADGSGPVAPGKAAYAHAFVALAAATAAGCGIPGGTDLLGRAVEVLEARFLREGRVVEQYDRAFADPEPYRGANASMHMVEALLAVGDVLQDSRWHRTALGIAEHLVHEVARERGYLLPEHFDEDWRPLPDYHHDRPADPFRPYGVTPGHLLEWSRLLLQLEAGLPDPPGWLLEDALGLFATGVRLGWAVDGAPGFVYTVDWDGRPVVRTRMHWVVAEAISAAGAFHRRTGDAEYAGWSETWWAYVREHVVDAEHGSWHHELDARNRPAATVWEGKPDIYHAFQALLLPRLPLAPGPAVLLG
jgi:sulfoquinovose isomerase